MRENLISVEELDDINLLNNSHFILVFLNENYIITDQKLN